MSQSAQEGSRQIRMIEKKNIKFINCKKVEGGERKFTSLSQPEDPKGVPFSQGFFPANFVTEPPQKFSSCFKGNQWALPSGFAGQCSDSWLPGRYAKCSQGQSHKRCSGTSVLLKCLNIFVDMAFNLSQAAIPEEKSESSR